MIFLPNHLYAKLRYFRKYKSTIFTFGTNYTKFMKKLILTNSLFLISFLSVFSQNLTNVDQVCPSFPVDFTAPSDSNVLLYDWDFCTGDLSEAPDAFTLTSFSSFSSDGMEIVRDTKGTADPDDDEWFGFVTNVRSGTLIRVEFGNSLDNRNPDVHFVNLGFTNCYEMAFIQENDKWYAIITRNNNPPLLVEFDSLRDNNLLVTVLNDPIQSFADDAVDGVIDQSVIDTKSGFTVKLFKDGDDIIGVFLNNLSFSSVRIKGLTVSVDDTRMVLVNFGNSIKNTITPADVITTANLGITNSAVSSTPGFDIIKDGNRWYGVTCGTNHFVHLDFGENLFSVPTTTNITSNISGLNPSLANVRLRLAKDGSNYLAFVMNTSGQLVRLDFGENMSNLNPTLTNFGTLGVIVSNGLLVPFTLDLVKQSSQWKAFVISRDLNNQNSFLYRVNFPNPCNATPTSSNEQNPSNVTFLLPEDIEVNLETYDNQGLLIDNIDDVINIQEATVGNFGVVNQCIGETTIFENFSFGSDENVALWDWDFGDGTNSTLKSPTHSYAQIGSYPVTLRVVNRSGCENTTTRQINITDAPNADFIIHTVNCTDRSVEFEDLSGLSNTDLQNGVEIITREWFFGDNTSFIASTDQSTGETRTNILKGNSSLDKVAQSPAYPNDDIYQVSLTIINSENCVSTVSKIVSFREIDKPTVDFEFDQVCAGIPTTFRDLSTVNPNAIGDVDTWNWKVFDPNGIAIDSSGLQNPTFVFDLPGVYSVQLASQFSGACANQTSKEVEVIEGLTSDFEVSTDIGLAPLRVSFQNSVDNAASFVWKFGDGKSSNEESPIYTYTEPGIYIVEFQARNVNDCGTIATKSITVLEENKVTSQEPLFAQEIIIYPNPTSDKVLVDFANPGQFSDLTIELLDLYGKKLDLQSNPSASGDYNLDLEMLPAGIYLLRLSSGGQSLIKRINKL